MRVINFAAEATQKHRWAIVVFWLCLVWPLGIYYGPLFVDNCVSTGHIDFPRGTQTPNEMVLQERKLHQLQFVLMVSPTAEKAGDDGKDWLLEGPVKEYVTGFGDRLETYWNKTHAGEDERLTEVDQKFNFFYLNDKMNLPKVAHELFWSENATWVMLETLHGHSVSSDEVIDAVVKISQEDVPEGYRSSISSRELLERDVLESLEGDVSFIHTVTAPLAIIILLVTLGNIHVMIIPFVTIVSSILGTVAAMYPISKAVDVIQFAPLIMVAFSISIGTDYCLFMLSRFLDERKSGMNVPTASLAMLESSGHTIFVSGIILCLSTLSFFVLPVQMLATMGIGLGITVAITLAANLSLVPAILHIMDGFKLGTYSKNSGGIYSLMKSVTSTKENAKEEPKHDKSRKDDEDEASGNLDESQHSERSEKEKETEDMENNNWFKLGKGLFESGNGTYLMIFIAALSLPAGSYLMQTKTSFAATLQSPRSGASINTFSRLGDTFGYGTLYDNEIWFDSTLTGKPITEENNFKILYSAVEELKALNLPGTSSETYSSIAAAGSFAIGYRVYKQALACGYECKDELKRSIAILNDHIFMHGKNQTKIRVVLAVDPTSSVGVDWYVKVRKRLQELKDQGKLGDLDFTMKGQVSKALYVVESALNRLPLMIVCTLVTVYVFMAISFKSAVVPVLSILSILITQVFVYGSAVLVYQNGVLDFLQIRGLTSCGEMHWIPPIMTFTLVIGLGLDYDTFILSRVLEYRTQGYTHQSSIILALYKTRRTISAAGIIMAVSFAGLLHSDIPFLNQIAFLLSLAVLLDTYLVRTTVLPILLDACGDATWWPMTMPEARRDILAPKTGKGEEGEVELLLMDKI